MRDVLLNIRRNRLPIAIIVLVCVVAGLALAFLSPPRYQSETKVLFKPAVASSPSASDAALINQASSLVAAQIPTYTALATTSAVLDPAAKTLGLDIATSDLQGDVQASTTLNTAIVTITTESATAKGAAELANAVAASLVSEVQSQGSGSASVTIDGSVVEAPVVPTSPFSPSYILDVLVGLAVGVALSFIVVAVRESLRTTPDAGAGTAAPVDAPTEPEATEAHTAESEATESEAPAESSSAETTEQAVDAESQPDSLQSLITERA